MMGSWEVCCLLNFIIRFCFSQGKSYEMSVDSCSYKGLKGYMPQMLVSPVIRFLKEHYVSSAFLAAGENIYLCQTYMCVCVLTGHVCDQGHGAGCYRNDKESA